MNDSVIYDNLTQIFRDALMRDDVTLEPSYSAADVEGWDSLRHIEIIMAVEEQFTIKFTTRELDSMQTVGDLAETIKAKTQA